MNEMKMGRKIGFSVVDLILLILAFSCIISAVFQTQIRAFFGAEEGVKIEYTFLIENVTEEARNHPVAGEELILAENLASFGVLTSVEEKKSIFQSIENPEEQIEILILTCRAAVTAKETEAGFEVAGFRVKPGIQFSVQTPTASFVMLITMVKVMENE